MVCKKFFLKFFLVSKKIFFKKNFSFFFRLKKPKIEKEEKEEKDKEKIWSA